MRCLSAAGYRLSSCIRLLLNPNTIERKSVMNRLSLLLLISLCIYTGAASAVNSLATPEQTCQLPGSEGFDTVRLEGQ